MSQNRVTKMCIALSGSFVFHWIPYSSKVVFEMISKTETNAHWTVVALILGIFKSSVNPYLMMKYDSKIRRSVLKKIPFLKTPTVPTMIDRPMTNVNPTNAATVLIEN